MPSKIPRLALIGCGGNMRWHARRIAGNKEATIVAVADPVPEARAALIADAAIAPVEYDDYRRMLKAGGIDAVMISTPHAHHYAQVRDALNAGLHVVVEKPITIHTAEAMRLMRLAQKQNRFLVVSYQRLTQAEYAYGVELVAKGAIGQVCGAGCYITQRWGRFGGWRLHRPLSGGGFLFDTGSHLLASTISLVGSRPISVQATVDRLAPDVELRALLNVVFENGAYAGMNFLGDTKRHEEMISIHGTEGSLTFRQSEWKMMEVLLNNEPLEIPKRVRNKQPSTQLFEWMRNGGKGYQLPWVAAQTLQVTEGAYRSAETGGAPVRLSKLRTGS